MKAIPPHINQRLRVGAIGLAVVAVLIVIAGAILGSVTRERPVAITGGARPEMVANIATGNDSVAEPLSDMGVSPAAQNTAALK